MVDTKGCIDTKKYIEQGFVEAGWELDDSFSEHSFRGNDGHLWIVACPPTSGTDRPSYVLYYDVERNLSYRVKEIPTPRQAAMLIKEHGDPVLH